MMQENMNKNSKNHVWTTYNHLHVCANCGIVKRIDGLNSPCKGVVKVKTRRTRGLICDKI